VRVLHIASGSRGGAKLAADRLQRLQRTSGIISEMASFDDNTDFLVKSFSLVFLRKSSTLLQQINTKHIYGVFSTKSIESIDLKKIEKSNFDIIQIHNWFNILSPETLIYLSKISRLVFTLHDERLISGGCHNTQGCDNFKNSCLRCPGVHWGHKSVSQNKIYFNEIFSKIGKYAVVAPSKWIIDRANGQSILLHSSQVRVIPNVVSHSIDANITIKQKNKHWQLLFLASDIFDPKKGLNLLIKSLEEIYQNSEFTFHLNLVGSGKQPKGLKFPYTFHNFLSGEELKRVLDECDLCIVPSLADNLPSVLIEAIIHGNLVLASRAGGISEIIKDGETGFLSDIDVDALSLAIVRIFKLPEDRLTTIINQSQSMVRNLFAPDVINNSYLNLYNDLLNP
jgi:glycosyltransferase involved in cell wall biosynthesis